MAKIQYFKSKPNPHSDVEFFAKGEPIDEYGSTMHPTVEISLTPGHYEYESRYEIDHNYSAKQGDQLKLFDVHPSKINSAFADHRMRSQTPTVLGMAINESKKIGMGLTYSDDLSAHSAKLAKQGMELGVVSPNKYNPEAEQKNDIARRGIGSYEHTYSPMWFHDYDKAQPEEVKAGRETIRDITRQSLSARKTHMSEQFEDRQMKLPGFE